MANDEYTIKKLNVTNGIGDSRKGKKMCKMTQEVGSQKTQRTDANVDRVQTLVGSDRRLGVKLTAGKLNMGICSEEETKLWPVEWILHHSNASAHNKLRVRELLAKKSANLLFSVLSQC
jgi:hypothetical protein